MKPLTTVSLFLILVSASTASATPIHLELLGEVVSARTRGNFTMPSSVVVATPVIIAFDFDEVILGADIELDSITSGDQHAFAVGPVKAPSEVIKVSNGTLRIGDATLGMSGGNLSVSDNKPGGGCAGFSCSSWSDDSISILSFGDAEAFGEDINFTTGGGFISRATSFEPPSDVLTVGTSISDTSTWNSFPHGTLYITLKRTTGDSVGSIVVRLLETRSVPEPQITCLAFSALAYWPLFPRSRRARV